MDSELETLIRRRQLLEADQFFEPEIMQTEYLLTVFRSRPTRMENYEEEAFLMIIDHATVYPGQKIRFCLKNGLELEESLEEGGIGRWQELNGKSVFRIGYRIQNGRAEVVPEEAELVQRIFPGIIWKDLPLMELQSG